MFKMISPNMLKTFEQCPEKFMFKYVKGVSMPVNDEIFVTGKNIHAMASYYLRKHEITNMEAVLSPCEKNMWEYLKNLKYMTYDCINTEYNLSVKLGNHFFGGRIDALVKNGETYYILDYKTGSAPKNASFDFQTMVYLLSVRRFFNTDNIKFVYIDLKNKTEVVIDLTQDLVRAYEQRLSGAALKIDKSEFVPSKTGCDRCEYRIICHDKKLLN